MVVFCFRGSATTKNLKPLQPQLFKGYDDAEH